MNPRYIPLVEDLEHQVTAVVNQLGGVRMSRSGRDLKSIHVVSVAQLQIGTGGDELLHHSVLRIRRSQHQCRITEIIARVQVDRPCQQEIDDFGFFGEHGQHQQAVAGIGTLCQVGAPVCQYSDYPEMSPCDRL